MSLESYERKLKRDYDRLIGLNEDIIQKSEDLLAMCDKEYFENLNPGDDMIENLNAIIEDSNKQISRIKGEPCNQ